MAAGGKRRAWRRPGTARQRRVRLPARKSMGREEGPAPGREKGRGREAAGGSSRPGPAQPCPAHRARSAAALPAGGQPEGVGPPGGAGRRPQRSAGGTQPRRHRHHLRRHPLGRRDRPLPGGPGSRRLSFPPPPPAGAGTRRCLPGGRAGSPFPSPSPDCHAVVAGRPRSGLPSGVPGCPRGSRPPPSPVPPSPPRCHGHCRSEGRALPGRAGRRGKGKGWKKRRERRREKTGRAGAEAARPGWAGRRGAELRRTGLGGAAREGRRTAGRSGGPLRAVSPPPCPHVGAVSCRALGLSPRARCCSPARTSCVRGLPVAA